MIFKRYFWQCFIILYFLTSNLFAQNPLITDQFTADPSARVFDGKVYVYPSHDILAKEGKGRPGWFCMEDYHVFSSEDLTEWKDHGVMISQETVPWADKNGYSMWAPDCIQKNGKYYFYFPTRAQDTTYNGKGFSIGVAIAEKPYGPFVPQQLPITNVKGIDPNVFIDKDGQAYLYWSQGHIYGAKLKDNMLELASDPKILEHLPENGLKEGPYVFERLGIYYLTYPHVENKTERLEYAIADNPMGPFKMTGVIMDESPTGCWTNHHSIINFKDQWYLFYHHNDFSPDFDKSRSIRADTLSFNKDGSIKKVVPTLRGIGVSDATKKIQVDRYNRKGDNTMIAFNDSLKTFKGWHVILDGANQWVQYNSVDLQKDLKTAIFKVSSQTGATIQLRLDNVTGPLLSEVEIPEGNGWKEVNANLEKYQAGIHNLIIIAKDNSVEIDWIQFN